MERMIISAPFGNYLQWAGFTSTLGTFTLRPRGGLCYRLWRCLLTLRHDRRAGGWVNRLGLPNPGIDSLKGRTDLGDKIVSVYASTDLDWTGLIVGIDYLASKPMAVELNCSCPNVSKASDFVGTARYAAERFLAWGHTVIAKLPPVRWNDVAGPMYAAGVRTFHCCNTLPTPSGGLSGKTLKQFSMWCVSDLREQYGDDVTLIGGGGVSGPDDVRGYTDAGADHVAVGSVLLNPLRWASVKAMGTAAYAGRIGCR